MANEFIARNGITSLGNIVVSGSITTTGTVIISGSIASASFAATASSADNFLTRGTLTAQTLVVQTITSSVDFVTGSTRFGSILSNTHVFSGSVTMNPNGLFVSSSGNVGIGTTTPTVKLSVSGTIESLTDSGGEGGQILLRGNTFQYGIDNYLGNNFRIIRENDGTGASGIVLMNISASGNVGIGTATPTAKLEVNVGLNSLKISGRDTYVDSTEDPTNAHIYVTQAGVGDFSQLAGNLVLQARTQGTVYRDIIFAGGLSNGDALMTILGEGNVGIGTSAPTAKLEIQNSPANDWGLSVWGNTTTGQSYGGIIRGGTNSSDVAFRVNNAANNATYFTVQGNGNVGIGINNPTAQLQVSSASGGIISINSTVTNTFRGLIFQNNASSDGTEYAYLKYNATSGEFRIYANPAAFGGFMSFYSNNAESMRLNASGYLFIGATTNSGFASAHRIKGPSATEGNDIISIDGGVEYAGLFKAVSGANYSGAGTGIIIGRNTSTGRSINAGGTINASGADYAEYMLKATEDVIAKGDIVGINLEGKLTNMFADSISFVVKSTNPSYVGGDIWGSVDNIGKLNSEATEEEKAAYNTKLEIERAKVDRIAFSGQVPCNVTGANVGDYIIPIELENGKIGGQAVTNPTFEQYQISVGKVWKIMDDGRAWIAVKIG